MDIIFSYACDIKKAMDWSSIALIDIIEIFAFRFFVILCSNRDGYIRYSLKSCLLYDQPKDLCTHEEFYIPARV